MLTLKLLREQPDFVIERLAVKNFDAAQTVKDILEQLLPSNFKFTLSNNTLFPYLKPIFVANNIISHPNYSIIT